MAGGIGISKDIMALRNQHHIAAHPAQPHPLTDRVHGRRWRPRLSALAAGLLLAGAAWAQTAAPGVEKPIDIPAQALDKALGALARQTGMRIVYSTDLTEGKQAAALKGTLAPQQALERLLAGSGLVLKALPDGGFTVAPQPVGAEKETTLPVVRVKAAAERETATGPVVGYVAKRSATGTKTDTLILETPQSTSVLGRDELETRGALSVLEALRYVPGVVTQVYGEDTRGQDDWLNLRGFSGFGTSLYQDGLRMNTDANAFANQRSEPFGLYRIEVLRGPASALYGKGDAGGIINRVSKRPTAEAPRELELQLGNRDRHQISADLGGMLDEQGHLLFRLLGLGLETGTQDKYTNGDAVSNTRTYLAPSLTWSPSAETSLTLMSEFLRDRNDGFAFRYAPPGVGTRRSASILVGEPAFTGFDHDQTAIGYQFEQRLSGGWGLRQNTRLSNVDVTYRRITSRSLAGDGRTLERRVRVFKESNKQLAIDTHLEGQIKAGDIEHKLLLGFDAERQKTSNQTFTGAVGTLDAMNPIYGQTVAVSPTVDFDDSGQRLQQLGLYAQDQMRLTPNWLLTVGGRVDRSMLKSIDRMAGTAAEQQDSQVTGRLGINYLTGTGWSPYASFADSFLPVVGRDAYGVAFKPTQGRQLEAGVKFTPDEGRSLYTAAVFDLRKKNVLTTDAANPDFQVQKGAVRSRGLELEAKASFGRGFDLIANYTYNDVKIIKSNDADLGKTPTSTPRQATSTWLNYRVASGVWRGLGIGVGARHVGFTYNDAVNSSRNPAFTLFDAGVNYETGPWRLALNVSNLTNKEHVATCFESVGGGRQCLFGQERNAVFSAKYRF